MNLIVKHNKRILQSFQIDRNLFGEFPLQDDSIIIKDKDDINDVCLICIEEIEVNTKIKHFECCNKNVHISCFNKLVTHTNNGSNKLKCPQCRNESIGTLINNSGNSLNYCGFGSFVKQNKNTMKSPIYVDSDNNIIVRYSIFINKYNFFHRNNIRFTLAGYCTIDVIDIFNIICAFQNSDFVLFELLIFNIITKKNITKFTRKNVFDLIRYIKSSINEVSIAVKYKNNKILNCIDDCITNSVNILINSEKIDFVNNLAIFLNDYNSIVWFKLNTIENKRNFYNKYLVKICGEKFRNIIISHDIEESQILIIEYQHKHKKK